jgi:hypothetical protein
MHVSVSMLEFASSGTFSKLRKGLPRNELQQLLGIPDLWGTQYKLAIADLWRYGNVEFHFCDHQISFIFSDGNDLCDGGKVLTIDPWIVRKGIALREFTDALAQMDMPFTTEQYQYDETQQIVTTSGGAIFSFVVSPENQGDPLGLFWWSTHQKL